MRLKLYTRSLGSDQSINHKIYAAIGALGGIHGVS